MIEIQFFLRIVDLAKRKLPLNLYVIDFLENYYRIEDFLSDLCHNRKSLEGRLWVGFGVSCIPLQR
jgi:hypothetical protein